MQLYPLKFKAILQDKIWGGKRLKEVLNKQSASDEAGESWELSGLPGNDSIVLNGSLEGKSLSELIKIYKGELLGNKIFERSGVQFPLLYKFIDANDNLSIQVHPDDALAWKRNIGLGKTEMWYVVDAEEDASLILGFNEASSPETYQSALAEDKVEELLNKVPVRKGDFFFIPAGLVHAIGKGLVIAEIQQSSDTTYRIYDYKRKDAQGNYRQLHVEEALEAIEFSPYESTDRKNAEIINTTQELVSCPYFTVNKIVSEIPVKLDDNIDSFKVLMCIEGECKVEIDSNFGAFLRKGETLLIPACLKSVSLFPENKMLLLESYID